MKSLTKAIGAIFICVSTVALMAACGGGGGGAPEPTTSSGTNIGTGTGITTPTTPVTPSILGVGLWREADSSAFNYMLVEPDGQMWGITRVSTISNVGSTIFAEKGQISVASGSISGTYSDVNQKSCALLYTCKVTGLASATLFSAAGSKSIPSASTLQIPDWSFNGSPEPSYSVAATVSALAKTWTVDASIASNFDAQGSLVIGTSGSITVTNIGGCSFAGSLTPVSGRGYFRLSLSSVNGTCASGVLASQINGVAFKTDVAGRPSSLHVMWHNPTLTQYFWGVGR